MTSEKREVRWSYCYWCEACDDCFPYGEERSDDTFATEAEAKADALARIGAAPWGYRIVQVPA